MINNERIVPIQKIDRLSAIGEILNLVGVSFNVLNPSTIEGDFKAPNDNDISLASQPVKTLDFTDVSYSPQIYFIPAYDFAGFTKDGTALNTFGSVQPDGVTLYKVVFSGTAVYITPITPQASTD